MRFRRVWFVVASLALALVVVKPVLANGTVEVLCPDNTSERQNYTTEEALGIIEEYFEAGEDAVLVCASVDSKVRRPITNAVWDQRDVLEMFYFDEAKNNRMKALLKHYRELDAPIGDWAVDPFFRPEYTIIEESYDHISTHMLHYFAPQDNVVLSAISPTDLSEIKRIKDAVPSFTSQR